MSREATKWTCDNCGAQQEGGQKPPEGWIETSFFTGIKFVRHAFCSYSCLAGWASGRYDLQPKEVDNET